jgi:glycosyltransferase involved in cell wall biosynthesis
MDQDFEEMPANHPDYVRSGLGNLDNARAYMASLMLARYVTVPNTSMASALSMARCPVRVVPDGWSAKNPLWRKTTVRRGTLNLGWAGLPGHVDDVVQARRVIARIMREFPMTQLVISGDAKVYQLFEGLPEQRKLYLPVTNVEESPYTFAQFDVLFQPLRNIPFNRATSDRNLMEAGVRRIPWVASPMPAFEEWAEGGLLADSVENWFDALHRLASSEELRQELGEKGYQKARQREMRVIGRMWLSVVEDCLGGVPTLVSQAFSDD